MVALKTQAEIWSTAVSADVALIALGCGDGTLQIRRLDDLTLVNSLQPHTAAIVDVAFSRDGRQLATASLDGSASVFAVDKLTGASSGP